MHHVTERKRRKQIRSINQVVQDVIRQRKNEIQRLKRQQMELLLGEGSSSFEDEEGRKGGFNLEQSNYIENALSVIRKFEKNNSLVRDIEETLRSVVRRKDNQPKGGERSGETQEQPILRQPTPDFQSPIP